jgi:hypothetical protein
MLDTAKPRKLNPTRPQFIWRVKTTAIDVPREFWRYAVPGFTPEPRVIWTRQRRIALQISKADEQSGGHPWPFQYEARQCLLCGWWRIGYGAQIQRESESIAWLSGKPLGPCSPRCEHAGGMIKLFSDPPWSGKYFSDWLSLPESADGTSNLLPHLPHNLRFSNAVRGCSVGSHGGKATTDQREKLDIRLLRQAGYLVPAARFQFGNVTGKTGDSALTIWCIGGDGENTQPDLRQDIQLLRTPCNYGSERKWFRCPAKGCGRRVAILYRKGDGFACRHCCQLGYRSQREGRCVLSLKRAQNIRTRLGGSPEWTQPFPPKPKGMHRKRYQRFQLEHERLVDNLRREPWRSVQPFGSPNLSPSDRRFVEMYVAVSDLEQIAECYPRLTLKKCRRLWTRPEIRAACNHYFEIANIENARLAARHNYGRLDAEYFRGLLVERIENSTGMERIRAIELGLKLTGVL